MPYYRRPRTREEIEAAYQKRLRRKFPTNPVALLKRDHNWRMGRLRALQASAGLLDDDLRQQFYGIIQEQMNRDKSALDLRLMMLRYEVSSAWDAVAWTAIREAENNKKHNEDAERLRQSDKMVDK